MAVVDTIFNPAHSHVSQWDAPKLTLLVITPQIIFSDSVLSFSHFQLNIIYP